VLSTINVSGKIELLIANYNIVVFSLSYTNPTSGDVMTMSFDGSFFYIQYMHVEGTAGAFKETASHLFIFLSM